MKHTDTQHHQLQVQAEKRAKNQKLLSSEGETWLVSLTETELQLSSGDELQSPHQ